MPDSDGNVSFTPKELFLEIREKIDKLSSSFTTEIHTLTEYFSKQHTDLDTRVRRLEKIEDRNDAVAGYSKSIRGLTWAVGVALLGVLGNLAAHYFWH